jgi:hypothetical protein
MLLGGIGVRTPGGRRHKAHTGHTVENRVFRELEVNAVMPCRATYALAVLTLL